MNAVLKNNPDDPIDPLKDEYNVDDIDLHDLEYKRIPGWTESLPVRILFAL